VLVGPELCHNDEWLEATQQYVSSFLKAVSSVRARYHPLLRWTAKYIDADAKEVYKHRQRAADIIRPVLRARLDAEEQGTKVEHEDGIQWLINAYRANGKRPKAEQLAQDEMGLSVASIHSSSATLLSTLYDLIDHPDALKDIREEIMRVGLGRSTWDRPALASLRLLDSFMKESQRIHSVPEGTLFLCSSPHYTR
jgi:cytochrome P450